jgi:hypothetical protein
MTRRTTRPRGFAPWTPQASTRELLSQVEQVIAEYQDHLPLTVRQIFYRLVGAHGFDKTEQAYARLCEALNRARRAQILAMDVIRDDGGHRVDPEGWQDSGHFLRAVVRQAQSLRLDRTAGQPKQFVIMCEAAGMVPQLSRVAEDYGLPVISSGGFESVTEKHQFALDLAEDRRPAEVLHIGDHDPSGVHLFTALAEDVAAFAEELGGFVTFTRLAVTPGQISVLRLPTAPPKPTDRRAFAGNTCQAEAIPPDVLAQILREALVPRIDRIAHSRVLDLERRERRRLRRAFESIALGAGE